MSDDLWKTQTMRVTYLRLTAPTGEGAVWVCANELLAAVAAGSGSRLSIRGIADPILVRETPDEAIDRLAQTDGFPLTKK